jgi:hypothetical protein
MATDYEKQWPTLRVEWCRQKITDCNEALKNPTSVVERKKLEHDLQVYQRLLKAWESGRDA